MSLLVLAISRLRKVGEIFQVFDEEMLIKKIGDVRNIYLWSLKIKKHISLNVRLEIDKDSRTNSTV